MLYLIDTANVNCYALSEKNQQSSTTNQLKNVPSCKKLKHEYKPKIVNKITGCVVKKALQKNPPVKKTNTNGAQVSKKVPALQKKRASVQNNMPTSTKLSTVSMGKKRPTIGSVPLRKVVISKKPQVKTLR